MRRSGGDRFRVLWRVLGLTYRRYCVVQHSLVPLARFTVTPGRGRGGRFPGPSFFLVWIFAALFLINNFHFDF